MWFQLKIECCAGEQVEALSDTLEELGALSVMLTDKNDNPVLEPQPGTTPLWPEVIIQALYAQEEELLLAQQYLKIHWPHLQLSTESLEDKDWERAWMDDFKPQRFGQRLWVCPTWLTPPEPDAVNLILDPGLAFGTGTHPTTSLCLTWLEQADLLNKTVIDYGCGSGILSLAALKLGAKQVLAVDIDEQALIATRNNALMNHIGEPALQVLAPETLTVAADLVIANILLSPLIHLKERFIELLKPKSLLVVSGLLTEQENTLLDAYSSLFEVVEIKRQEDWSLVALKRL